MEQEIKEISEISFGIYSPEEIKRMSVCKVDNSKLCNTDKTSGYGTVYDPRMGTIDNGKLCATCNFGPWECAGHFGHIELNEPLIHPLYYKQVVSFLKCFCIKCYKLLITEEQINLNNLHKIKGVKRFTKILEKLEKNDMCIICSHPQPDIKHIVLDNTIVMVYKSKQKEKVSIVLQVDEIKKIFDNVSVDDVKLLGFNPDLVQPRNLVLTYFPVIPIQARPYVITEGNICDDDLTIQLVEIVKMNNHLEPVDGIPLHDSKKQKYLQCLKFRISTYYNNSGCRAKHSTSNRPIKGIKERLSGKDGLVRTNLMGKRVEQSGRTVIGAEPTLKVGQLAMPPQMASNLTIPVQVNNMNYKQMTELVNRGKVNFILKDNGATRINLENALFFKGTRVNHGDIIVRTNEDETETETLVTNGKELLKPGDKLKRNGEYVKDIKYPEKRTYQLNIGDICERQLQDGDIVLLNRQPTLHAGSMLAMEIVIIPGKTLRYNLSICKSFNSDFDKRLSKTGETKNL